MHWASINYSKGRAEWGWGGVGPVRAEWGRVGLGPVRAGWGWGVHWDSIK